MIREEEEKRILDKVEDIEVTKVSVETIEIMEATEPVDTTTVVIVTADKEGEVHENSVRRLQALGNLL